MPDTWLSHLDPIGVLRGLAHVDEIEVERFPRGFAVASRPMAILLFVDLEYCDHTYLISVPPGLFIGPTLAEVYRGNCS